MHFISGFQKLRITCGCSSRFTHGDFRSQKEINFRGENKKSLLSLGELSLANVALAELLALREHTVDYK